MVWRREGDRDRRVFIWPELLVFRSSTPLLIIVIVCSVYYNTITTEILLCNCKYERADN